MFSAARRRFLQRLGLAALGALLAPRSPAMRRALTLFLCGDVMTGRGVDQILPHPSRPRLYEAYVDDAREYVKLAERQHGILPSAVPFNYIWGEALAELERVAPDARIINLETAVTTSDRPWPKGINYRMHPANVPCLSAAAIDCCVLANNHVLDWGRAGLVQTLATLAAAGIKTAGAGLDLEQATAPAILPLPGQGRILVFAYGSDDSGIGDGWEATSERPGIALLADLSERSARRIAAQVAREKRDGDIVIASIHWGGNWGYAIPPAQREFAHALIELAGVDVIHGHSSHHVKGIEVYRGRLILYGCGDFLNDYEGIGGHEQYRGELGLMYFPTLDPGGRLLSLAMTPTRIEQMQIRRASPAEAGWLAGVIEREGRPLGSSVTVGQDHRLLLQWRD